MQNGSIIWNQIRSQVQMHNISDDITRGLLWTWPHQSTASLKSHCLGDLLQFHDSRYIVQSLKNMTLWIPIIKLAQAHMMWIFKVECQENKKRKLFYLTSLRPVDTNILKIVLNLIKVQIFNLKNYHYYWWELNL